MLKHTKSSSTGLDTMEQRLAQLPGEIAIAQADIQAEEERRQEIATSVAKLTEQASTGALKDPNKLVEALRQQRELVPDQSAHQRLEALQSEQERLQQEIHVARQKAAIDAYHDAVQQYAQACAPLPKLAVAVRETAVAAGILLSDSNSRHLVGRDIQIGGAVIDIPAEEGVAR